MAGFNPFAEGYALPHEFQNNELATFTFTNATASKSGNTLLIHGKLDNSDKVFIMLYIGDEAAADRSLQGLFKQMNLKAEKNLLEAINRASGKPLTVFATSYSYIDEESGELKSGMNYSFDPNVIAKAKKELADAAKKAKATSKKDKEGA